GNAAGARRARVAGTGKEQTPNLGIVVEPRRDPPADAVRDDPVRRERGMRAVRLGRTDGPEQHGRAGRVKELLNSRVPEVRKVDLVHRRPAGDPSLADSEDVVGAALPARAFAAGRASANGSWARRRAVWPERYCIGQTCPS